MRVFSILFALVYSTICLAQLETQAFTELLGNTLNSTFAEVVDEYPYLEKCYVIDGNVNDCVILSEDEADTFEEAPDTPLYRHIKIDSEYTNLDEGKVKVSLFTQTTPLGTNKNRTTDVAEAIKFEASILTDLTTTPKGRKLFTASTNVNITANTMSVLKSVVKPFGECTRTPINDDTTNAEHNSNIQCYITEGINDSSKVIDLQTSFQNAALYAKCVYGKKEDVDSKECDELDEFKKDPQDKTSHAEELHVEEKKEDAAISLIGDIFSTLKIEAKGDDLVLSFEIQDNKTSFTAGITDNLTAQVTLTVKESGLYLNAAGEALFEIKQADELKEKIKKIAAELAIKTSETHVNQFENRLYQIFGVLEGFLDPVPEEEGDDEGEDECDDFECDEDEDFDDADFED